jgi:hypothetical protein
MRSSNLFAPLMQMDDKMPELPSTATTLIQHSASHPSPSVAALMRSKDDIVADPEPTGSMLPIQTSTPCSSHITRTYRAAPATSSNPTAKLHDVAFLGHYASAHTAAIDNPRGIQYRQRVRKFKEILTQGLIDASFESGHIHRTHTGLQTFQQADSATFHPLHRVKPCLCNQMSARKVAWQIQATLSHGNLTKASKALENNIIVLAIGEALQQLTTLPRH